MQNPNRMVPEVDHELILDHLTGTASGTARPPAITPPGKGGKFDLDGAVLDFPGNTFICHLNPNSDFYAAVVSMQDGLKAEPLAASCLAFLPRPSFHMTVFCGVSGSPLGDDGWPQDIESGADLKTVTAIFRDKLARFSAPEQFRVRAAGLNEPGSLFMLPNEAEDITKLRDLRGQLQELTQLYRPDFPTYRFHVSLAYLRHWLPLEQAKHLLATSERLFFDHFGDIGPVELGPVEFCEFRNMHHFEPVGLLTPASLRLLR